MSPPFSRSHFAPSPNNIVIPMVSSSMRLQFSVLAFAVAAHAQVPIGGKKFERSLVERGPKGEWVMYEKGAPQNPGTRRWLTHRVLVELAPGQGIAGLQNIAGVVKTEARGRFAVVEFGGTVDAAVLGAAQLKQIAGVTSAEPMLARQLFHCFIPNDPLFAHSTAQPGYQWHLRNTGQNGAEAGIDLNVVPAWDSYKGAGVRIAIVDDGLQTSHPDFVTNIDTANDYDFNGLDNDPSPGVDDFHGTACAGVAAARGNNGIGISGSAPEATLVGLRLIAAPTTDAEEADAFAYRQDIIAVKSNSWGPYDSAYGHAGPGPLSLAAMQDATTNGRGGKGTVFLWAAGNGNGSGDDSNYDGWANSPLAIAVSAINDKGRASYYTEPGANILVCAPSSGGKQGITTTDRIGNIGYNEDGGTVEHPNFANTDYTNAFGGTSSATPAVAGVVALMLQANPNLKYRDVQEILVRTAVQNDEFDGGWVTNGGGFHFNPTYGAGLVDAAAATTMAATWTNVAALQTKVITQTALAQTIPDADANGTSRTFTVPLADNLRLEHVTVKIKATHPYVGQLEWRLTSPSGVESRLARPRFNDVSANIEWTFMTTHFWGERSHGNWKLEVIDRTVDHSGQLDEATLTFHGTPTSTALPVPRITSNWIVFGRVGLSVDFQITASNFPTSYGAGRYYQFGLPAGLSLNTTTGRITGVPTESGVFEGYTSATNATGSNSIFTYFYIQPATPGLAAAVEQPSTTAMLGFGFAQPFVQTTITHDGVDAIETGIVEDEEYSGIEFTVNGPARLDFYWKVSSEKNYDYMVLAVDGYVKDYLTGEQPWTMSSTDLGPGEHNVDIYYFKDEATAKGQDKGWIDQITITPTTSAPIVTAATVHAYQGIYFRHQIAADHAPSTYTATGLPSGLTLHATTGLIYGSVAALGSYPVTISATNSIGTSSAIVTIEVSTVNIGLAEAIDATAQTIVSSGDLPWNPNWLYTTDGKDAARSGTIAHEQTTVMSTDITGPSKVVFYWGVSSEADYDYLRFFIDNVEQAAISGEVGWTRKGFIVGPGTHTLKWSYSKDEATISGLDSGFLDRFSLHSDADGDGIHNDIEAWFGTSDSDSNSLPATSIARGINSTLTFPSVIGNNYLIQHSDDLIRWHGAAFIEATSTTTSWIDLNATTKARRFYRVAVP
jgi:subtilisin-like proprotein convertase family protein